ncbi:MAG: hypothetical protein IJ091_07530 [Oscillospiraceae bacterium]|nr:hypothetical protein [Oscillospiraceae bacterium]
MTIEYLYPEICNLYGDSFNFRYLKRLIPEGTFIETNLKSTPFFVDHPVDMLYLGATTEDGQKMIIERLLPYKEKLNALIETEKVVLCTGNSFEVFGREIQNEDGTALKGLALFDFVSKREMLNRYNSIFLGKMEGFDVVGFKSQFSHSYGDNENTYVMNAVKGCGLNPKTQKEGFRRKNFIGTYIIGPLLLLNPPFTKYLLGILNVHKELAFEEEAMKAYQVRLEEYHRPDIKLES